MPVTMKIEKDISSCSECKSSCKCGMKSPMHAHSTTPFSPPNQGGEIDATVILLCQWCSENKDEGH